MKLKCNNKIPFKPSDWQKLLNLSVIRHVGIHVSEKKLLLGT